MFPHRDPFFKFLLLVIFFGSSVGFLFNYYSGNSRGGFVSPVVFGKEAIYGVKKSSPFSALFNKLVPQTTQPTSLTESELGYLGKSGNKTGAVLGEKTISGSGDNLLGSVQNNNNSNSGTSGTSGTSSSSSSTNSSSSPSLSSTTAAPQTSGSLNVSNNQADNYPSQTPTNSTSTVLTNSQQAVEDVTNLVSSYLKSQNYVALYNLMSSDFKNTFSLEDFVSSFSGSPSVSSIALTSAPKIYGSGNEWAEQSVRLTLIDGSEQNYLNIYHLEGSGVKSAWTLFATQDQ